MVFADGTSDPGYIVRQDGQFRPGGGGPVQRSWRCGPCERESQLEGYSQYSQVSIPGVDWAAVEAASVTGTEASSVGAQSNIKSIALGVGTGLAVWIITRMLDKVIFGKGRR